jgi:hypothetical protein
MIPDQLRAALRDLHWSQRGLAEILRCDDRLVRRWITGELTVPPDVAGWLQDLADLHSALPPPAAWRRRGTSRKAVGEDVMPTEPTIEVANVSWDWQPGGRVTARGEISVARGGAGLPPITLSFQIPMEPVPTRAVMTDPGTWVLGRLRQALRSPRPTGAGPAPVRP